MDVTFAKSIAGHDAGKTYFVAGEEGGRLLLADGVSRKMSNPKKKNPAHVQKIKHLPQETVQMLSGGLPNDDMVRRAIQIYQSQING